MKKLQKNIKVRTNKHLFFLRITAVLAALLFFLPSTSFASHIVGGSIGYRCLGGQEYEITLRVYRDCFYGAPNAQFDDPAFIGVFNPEFTTTALPELKIDFVADDTLDAVLNDECLFVPSDVCVHTTTYRDTITLAPSEFGYRLVYQRCCRNETINNIVTPNEVGATYSIEITPDALDACNTSPVFNNYPPVFICVNNPIDFDHSASDDDGDSLVYKLCTPLTGASLDDPKPLPSQHTDADPVVFQQGYGLDSLLGGQGNPMNQNLRINRHTGRLRGFPTLQGQFVVGICVEEYRNGVKISETRRDFQYNVGQCEEVIADIIAPDAQCDNLTVDFGNSSLLSDEYQWFFDFPNADPAFTSTEESLTFTYPDTGRYTVALIAEPNSQCVDTLFHDIYLQNNSIAADILVESFDCSDSSVVALTDLSTDSISPLNMWSWELVYNEDTLRSNLQNPVLSVPVGVTGTVSLIVSSVNGCEQTVSEPFETGNDNPGEGIPDTVYICAGDAIALNPDADSLTSYNFVWSPEEGLDDPNSFNPIASPTESTTYTVMISPVTNVCSFSKTVTVLVSGQTEVDFEVGALSCDGLGLTFENQSQNADEFIWYFGDTTNTSTEANPTFVFDSIGTYTITLIGDNIGDCPDTLIQEITVEERILDAAIGVNFEACMEDSVIVTFLDASVNSTNNTVSWDWTFSNAPPSTEESPTYTLASGQDIIATLTITTDDDCTATVQDTFAIESVSIDLPDSIQICLNDSLGLNPNGNPGFQYQWSPEEGLDDPNSFNPIANPTETTTYTVIVSSFGGDTCQVEASVVVFVPTPFELAVSENIMTCDATADLTGIVIDGENLMYNWTGPEIQSDPTEPSITVGVSGLQSYTLMVTDALGCTVEETITVSGGPVDVPIPDTVAVCQGEEVVINLINDDPNDTLTYSWTPTDLIISGENSPNPDIDEMLGETTFTVEIENQFGCSMIETVLVAVVDTTMMLSFDSEVQCNGTSVQFTNTSTNAFGYFWDFGDGTTSTETNPLHDYGEAGTYDVYLTIQYDVSCTDTIFAQVTTMEPQLIADFSYDFSEGCANDSVTIQFTDLSMSNFQITTYQWDFGNGMMSMLQNPSITLTESETLMVTLIITSNNGCQDTTDVVIIDVEVPNIPDIMEEHIICLGDSVPLNPNGNTDYTFVWTPADGLDDPLAVNLIASPTETTTYTVEITIETETDTCTVTQEVTVIVADQVEVMAPDDMTTCGEDLTLTAIGSDTLIYVWTDSNGDIIAEEMTATVNPDNMEMYIVTVMNEAGCTASDTVKVTNNEVNIEVENGTEISVCQNEEIVLMANNLDANDTLTCVWTTDGPGIIVSGENTPNPTVLGSIEGPTTFTLACTNQFECTDTIEVVVITIEFDAQLPEVVDVCAGVPTFISPDANPDYTYLWSPADCVDDPTSPNPMVTVTEDKTLTVMVSNEIDGFLCETEMTIEVNVPAPIQLETSKDTVLCEVTELILFASSAVPVTYEWSNGQTDSMITVMPDLGTTTYTVVATDEFDCIEEGTIVVNTFPINIELNGAIDVCANIDTEITATNLDPAQELIYEWSPMDIIVGATNDSTVIINTDTSGTLSANITNQYNCTVTEEIALNVIDVASGLDATVEPMEIVLSSSATLNAGIEDPECAYEWTPAEDLDNPNSANTVTTPLESGDILYTVTASKGECSASDTVTLRVIQAICEYPNIFFPNTFTPNGDNENDELQVYANPDFIEEMELIIYNRWGQKVFQSNSQNNTWDGTFNGEVLQPDVFGYYLRVQCVNGEELIDKGNVSILK